MAKPKIVMGTATTPRGEGHGSESRLESLPRNLLVQIICHLSHNHLRNVSQVSRTLRDAVQSAKEFHFNYITPDHSRVNLQRAGRWSDPLPRTNMPKPTRRGDITPRRLDFSRLRMEE